MKTFINSYPAVQKAFAILAIFALVLSSFAMTAITVQANHGGPYGDEEVKFIKLCHWDASAKPDPVYKSSGSVAVEAGINGHDGHVNDIIPPFHYKKGNDSMSYPGKNWTPGNAELWALGGQGACGDVGSGTIVIEKVTDLEGESIDFDFSGDLGSFTLAGNEDTGTDFENVTAGEYTISETGADGWSLSNLSCVSDTDDSSFDYSVEDEVTITLEADDSVTCTFTNTKDTPPPLLCEDPEANNEGKPLPCTYDADPGSITIYKVVNNEAGNAVEFDFTVDASDDSFDGSFGLNGGANNSRDDILPGTYTFTEGSETGWLFDDVICSAEGNSTFDYEVANGVEITFTEGDDVSCTFYNDIVNPELHSISGTKYDWNTENELSGWTIFLDENDNQILDDGEVSTVTDVDGNYSFGNLENGTYSVCEVMQNGWEQMSPETANGCYSVEVDDQNVIDRDFWNRQTPSETIEMCKIDEFENPVVGWGMTLSNGTQEGTYDLVTGDNGCVSQAVNPEEGPWVVTEENRTGWEFMDVSAQNGLANNEAEIPSCEFFPQVQLLVAMDTEPGYNCTFQNDRTEEAPACEVGDNLLLNSSFEEPVVEDSWDIFGVVANWLISTDGLELWNNFMGGASDGDQNAELDGNSPTTITQTVVTTPGATYELRFDFSPRPDTGIEDNNVDATADGNLVVNASGDGSNLVATNWTTYSNTFVASDESTDIAFADKGTDNGVGSLIDNAVLCLVSNPDNGGGDDDDDDDDRGGGGNGIRISLGGGGDNDDEDEDEPVPQVLGEATSVIPAGAPNTGFGGAAPKNTEIPTLFTLLAMFVAFGAIRSTQKDA